MPQNVIKNFFIASLETCHLTLLLKNAMSAANEAIGDLSKPLNEVDIPDQRGKNHLE
jgi:hypothetical protein